ncbi:flagellar biosynthesis protein FlhF [Azospira inquinata]|uniref:Flagellar biosynthesis protein FlhF n=1 Tax=Azospira inquinata TaxID=2785627 RepID=A0A975XU39_9RHOO|nr:flagellar biosynthesis protein FlhF [Azospira inquinata]QWT46282.1 flagellar biosynthesis protein FlhF [Azospira inquinata]QWT48391.1 flagellar biosynthesis protein FlhF [Azospira inquinata]
MNVKKFIAASARDALRKVKETLGPDAIILSNRGVPGGVEIMAVASRDMAMIVPTPARHEVAVEDYKVSLAGVGRGTASAAPTMAPRRTMNSSPRENPMPQAAPTPAPAVTRAVPRPEPIPQVRRPVREEDDIPPSVMMDEIRALRKIVEQHLAGFAWGEAARLEPVKTEMLRHMLDAGFSPQFSREMLLDLPHELDMPQALAWVKGAADRCLRTITSDSDVIDQGGVFALVGPTGVGKTTTTAKLAARCVVRHGASKLALVTTDGYRIGAHEQLRIYGRILGVSVHLVKDAADLHNTLEELSHKHMVLIDTMGMSQKDRLVSEQISMLVGSGGHVRRLLCLSATSRGDTLDDVINAYQGDDLAGCILTKVDEAASLATPLDAVMRHQLCLHYVSNGQRVPEDLHLPNRAYLLHRAFKDLPETSPHRLSGLEPGLMMANAGVANGTYGGRRG